jgi:hypothetical protein
MEDDFELLSEAICELLEQRLREMEPPKRHTWVERGIAWEQNPIELPEELAYRVLKPQDGRRVRRASKPLSKCLH